MPRTADQVLSFARDGNSVRAATPLAVPAKWLTYAQDDAAVWGEYKGSDSQPYRTVIDLRRTSQPSIVRVPVVSDPVSTPWLFS